MSHRGSGKQVLVFKGRVLVAARQIEYLRVQDLHVLQMNKIKVVFFH
jgi:hypothetical protein